VLSIHAAAQEGSRNPLFRRIVGGVFTSAGRCYGRLFLFLISSKTLPQVRPHLTTDDFHAYLLPHQKEDSAYKITSGRSRERSRSGPASSRLKAERRDRLGRLVIVLVRRPVLQTAPSATVAGGAASNFSGNAKHCLRMLSTLVQNGGHNINFVQNRAKSDN
jgi:hypothetical protein